MLNTKYDFILINDVLDHAADPLDMLEQVNKIRNPETKIVVRCHPWTSRHGTHVYKQMNKAFLHLIFNPYHYDQCILLGESSNQRRTDSGGGSGLFGGWSPNPREDALIMVVS